jgi:hypothetical protein
MILEPRNRGFKVMDQINPPEANNSDTPPQSDADRPKPRRPGWREILPIHPAAAVWPELDDDELRDFADDIAANGLEERIGLCLDEDDGVLKLLEGQNRLTALERLENEGRLPGYSYDPGSNKTVFVRKYSARAIGGDPKRRSDKTRRKLIADDPAPFCPSNEWFEQVYPDDPYAYVKSKNHFRRHLTREKRREIAERVFKDHTEWSNRRIAREAELDDKTVGAIRDRMEATAEIPQLEETVGRDGKTRPATKPPKAPSPPLAPEDADDGVRRMKAAHAAHDGDEREAPDTDEILFAECTAFLSSRIAKMSPAATERLSAWVYAAGGR